MAHMNMQKMAEVSAVIIIYLIIMLPVSAALSLSPPYAYTHQNNVMINWTSDVAATSEVDYGTTPSLGKSQIDNALTLYHEITISNLVDGVYYYKIAGEDSSGSRAENSNSGSLYTFVIDTTPPNKVTNLHIVSRNLTSLTIAWDSAGNDVAYYLVYEGSQLIANTTSTLFVHTGLEPDSVYVYHVIAVDSHGNVADPSDSLTGITQAPDLTPPSIYNITLLGLHDTSFSVNWITSELSNSKIYYWQENHIIRTVSLDSLVRSHNLTVTGLTKGCYYFYILSSCDGAGNCANSTTQTIIAGADMTPPPINAVFPTYTNKERINIKGTTEPYATLKISVNHVALQTVKAGKNGSFEFRNIPLSADNTIKIEATDLAGNPNSREWHVVLDTTNPELSITIPSSTTTGTIIVNGSVYDSNSPVIIDISVIQSADTTPPGEVTNLRGVTTPNGITLSWDELNESDILYYAVYREDKGIIATTYDSSFTDLSAGNSTYQYQVFAVDKSCNKGVKSNPVVVRGPAKLSMPVNSVPLQCYISRLRFNASGKFNYTISVNSGSNLVVVRAIDPANNTASITKKVILDTDAPSFTTNLEELSPSYVDEVTIAGRASENCTIEIYVNGDKEAEVHTDSDLNFKADVPLSRDWLATQEEVKKLNVYGLESTNTEVSLGTAWINNITIVATDESGLQSKETGYILYALCGYGNDWDIQVSTPMPNELVPRHIIEGIADIALEVNLTWNGAGDTPAIVGHPVVRPGSYIPLKDRDDYDFDWLKGNPQSVWSTDNSKGYVVLKLKKIDPTPKGQNWTMYQKEENISNNHKGECTMPGMGCVKIPLEITVDYTNPDKKYYADNPEVPVTKQQKQCINLEVAIQPRMNPDVIPENFLKASIDMLNATLGLIDGVLPLIEDVNIYTTYACLALWAAWFIAYASEWTGCHATGFDYGSCALCEDASCQNLASENSKAPSYCSKCIAAKAKTIMIRDTLHQVCDRVMCPSAPTFKKYVVDVNNDKRLSFSSHCSKLPYKTYADFLNGYMYQTPEQLKQLEEKCSKKRVIHSFLDLVNPDKLTESEYNQYKDTLDPECCALEYLYEYSTVCGLGNVKMGYTNTENFDWFNEYIHSGCDSYNKMDLKERNNLPPELQEAFKRECGGIKGIFDAYSNFKLCKPDTSNGEEILVHDFAHADDWYAVENKRGGSVTKVKVSEAIYKGDSNKYKKQNQEYITKRLWNIQYDCSDNGKIKWAYPLTSNPGKKPVVGKELPDAVQNIVCGGSTEEYVVNPASDLLRSFQCVCISGFAAYLRMYRDMLMLIKNCFQQILITGDGSAGFCREVISIYICDLVYWALDCLTKPQSSKPGVISERGLIGFWKYATSAGSDIRRQISNRYGGTNLFQTMFVKRKLVHSVCMAAFTGDWNIDLGGMVRESGYIPIKSTVVVAPATRRFINFDPITGYTKHIYHIGLLIIAGADIKYDVSLVCSASNDCYDNPGGACDCFLRGQPQYYRITNKFGNGRLNAGQNINKGAYVVVEGNRLGNVRYDKVLVEYSYKDSSGKEVTEKKLVPISQVGGSPPAVCHFDIGTLSYKCTFDTSERGQAWFEAPPKPDDIYGIGDYLNFDLDIRTTTPEDPNKCIEALECDKWLLYEVKNQKGRVIANGYYKLPPAGRYYSTSDKGDPNGFLGHFLGGDNNGRITKDMFELPTVCTSALIKGTIKNNFDLKNCDGWGNSAIQMLVLRTPSSSTSLDGLEPHKFYYITGSSVSDIKEYLESDELDKIKLAKWSECDEKHLIKLNKDDQKTTNEYIKMRGYIECMGNKIYLNDYPNLKDKLSAFIVTYNPSTDVACEKYTPQNPAIWTVKTSIVGSELKGDHYERSNTPLVYNDQIQQYTTSVKVVCESGVSALGSGEDSLPDLKTFPPAIVFNESRLIFSTPDQAKNIELTIDTGEKAVSSAGIHIGNSDWPLTFSSDARNDAGLIKPHTQQSIKLGDIYQGGVSKGRYDISAYVQSDSGVVLRSKPLTLYVYNNCSNKNYCIPINSQLCGNNKPLILDDSHKDDCGTGFNCCKLRD